MVKLEHSQDQRGLVSITVAIIMMTIISLLIASYSLLARREQRLALDRRLSSQAFYAAESGINTAKKQIENGTLINNVNTCTPVNIGADDTVQTTCTLVNQTPSSIKFDGLGIDKSKVIKISTQNSGGSSTSVRRIEIYWNATGLNVNSFSSRSSGTFPKEFAANSNPFSVLSIALTRSPTASFNRDWLDDNTFHAILYPKANGSGASQNVIFSNDSAQGVVIEGNCTTTNTPKKCKATITMATDLGADFYLKMSTIYTSADVEILAYDATSGGNQLNFQGAQAVIDATGRATDVLRRVQAVIPLTNSWSADSFGIRSDDGICKQYEVAPSGTSSPGNICPFN